MKKILLDIFRSFCLLAESEVSHEFQFRQLTLGRYSILAPAAEFVILIQHVGQIGKMSGRGSRRKRLMRKPVRQSVIRPRQPAREIQESLYVETSFASPEKLFGAHVPASYMVCPFEQDRKI